MRNPILLLVVLFLFLFSCENEPPDNIGSGPEATKPLIMTSLPMEELDFSMVNTASKSWAMRKSIQGDYRAEKFTSEGEGNIITNVDLLDNLILEIDHADIELELEYLIPKNSNSGVYLQGRYEVQILDSWRKDNLTFQDAGAIYADYNSENDQTNNGSPPAVNASKAPGLWQHLRIIFRAPKFNEDGKKTQNALFEKVFLNDYLVQENIEAPKPTRAAISNDEVERGPLMLQGDHGQIAFRNIKYKKLGKEVVSIQNLKYKVYTDGEFNDLPDFTQLVSSKEGEAESLDNLQELAEKREEFGMILEGQISIPRSGKYLFTSIYDDGGDVFIGDQLILHNGPKDYENQPSYGLVDLEEGIHDIKLTYFQKVWGSRIELYVEGPEIPKHRIGTEIKPKKVARQQNKILKLATSAPEIQRGYVNYNDEKRTHVLSVGDPAGVNYSYDLRENCLLNIWRGEFADATNMWGGRGHSQLLLPLNATTSLSSGVPIAALSSKTAGWPSYKSDKHRNLGYEISLSGLPMFNYRFGELKVQDKITSSSGGNLSRSIEFSSPSTIKKLWYKIGEADYIRKIGEGRYNIGGNYFIESGDASTWEIRSSKSKDELIAPISIGTLNYEIIW